MITGLVRIVVTAFPCLDRNVINVGQLGILHSVSDSDLRNNDSVLEPRLATRIFPLNWLSTKSSRYPHCIVSLLAHIGETCCKETGPCSTGQLRNYVVFVVGRYPSITIQTYISLFLQSRCLENNVQQHVIRLTSQSECAASNLTPNSTFQTRLDSLIYLRIQTDTPIETIRSATHLIPWMFQVLQS